MTVLDFLIKVFIVHLCKANCPYINAKLENRYGVYKMNLKTIWLLNLLGSTEFYSIMREFERLNLGGFML